MGFGQRSRLVAAKHVHAAEIVDGRLPLDDHLLARHAQGAVREGDRHDHRQELGRQSDGERQREQEELQQRSMEEVVDEDHEQDEKDRRLHDHHAELLDAGRKGGRRRRLLERAGDRTELSFAPGRHDQRLGGSAHHRASHEYEIGRERGLAHGGAGRRRRALFGRVGLAGEKRFIDIEVARFDQPGIGGYEIAGREKNDIAGHDLRRWNVDRRSIAKRLGGKRDLLAQTLRGVLGLALLHHVEDHGHHHDGGDDDEARTSPVNADTPAAKSRIRTNGLLNRPMKSVSRPLRLAVAIWFGPTVSRMAAASDRAEAGLGGMQPLKEVGERNGGQVR